MNKEQLQKAVKLSEELNKIKISIEKELSLYLNQMCWHNAYVDTEDISINDNSVSFKYQYSAYGHAEDFAGVTWDYFDNPEEYIRLEKLANIRKQEREKEENAKKELERKQKDFERLKKELNK